MENCSLLKVYLSLLNAYSIKMAFRDVQIISYIDDGAYDKLEHTDKSEVNSMAGRLKFLKGYV